MVEQIKKYGGYYWNAGLFYEFKKYSFPNLKNKYNKFKQYKVFSKMDEYRKLKKRELEDERRRTN